MPERWLGKVSTAEPPKLIEDGEKWSGGRRAAVAEGTAQAKMGHGGGIAQCVHRTQISACVPCS